MQKLFSRMAWKSYDFDPNATTATEIGWVDMQNYQLFAAQFFRTIGTSNVTFSIVANSESDGSGSDVTVKTHAVGSQPDAVGDQLFLSVTAEEIAAAAEAAGTTARYVTAVVSVATNTDEGVVSYIRAFPLRAVKDLTADIVA